LASSQFSIFLLLKDHAILLKKRLDPRPHLQDVDISPNRSRNP
jgi:hypothetical protein